RHTKPAPRSAVTASRSIRRSSDASASRNKSTGTGPTGLNAGTMLGYLDVELPSGLIINGCKLMIGPAGKFWISPPAIQLANADGAPRLDTPHCNKPSVGHRVLAGRSSVVDRNVVAVRPPGPGRRASGAAGLGRYSDRGAGAGWCNSSRLGLPQALESPR